MAIDTSIYARQNYNVPDAASVIQNGQAIASNRLALEGQATSNAIRDQQLQEAQAAAAEREALKRDSTSLAQSTLALRQMNWQPTPDANGYVPRVIPGTEGYDVKNNWWYDKKTGEPVDPYSAPFYKPDGSPNQYSSKFIQANVDSLTASGASPAFVANYAATAEKNALEQGKAIADTIKAQADIQAKQQEIQKARSVIIANTAYDILNAPDPEHALQLDLMLNPQHAQLFGIDPQNPPNSPEQVQQFLETLKPIAATSEKAKAALAAKDTESQIAERKATSARADKQLAISDKQVVQGVKTEVDPDTGETKQVPTYAIVTKSSGDVKPVDLAPTQKDASGLGGATNQRFTDRIVNAANLSAEALKNIAQLDVNTATTGLFGRRDYHGSIMNTPLNTLVNRASPQDVQTYNAVIAGLGRTLGTLETAGMAVPKSLIDQLESGITAREGDSYATLMLKRAEARQIFEKGIQSTMARGNITDEQRKILNEQIEGVQKAIPYKVQDVIGWQNGKDKNLSFADYMKQKNGASTGPAKGTIVNGYVFMGGNPNDQKNWQKAK